MNTVNQNQFEVLTMDELVNTYGGTDPGWSEKAKQIIAETKEVLEAAAKAIGSIALTAAATVAGVKWAVDQMKK